MDKEKLIDHLQKGAAECKDNLDRSATVANREYWRGRHVTYNWLLGRVQSGEFD